MRKYFLVINLILISAHSIGQLNDPTMQKITLYAYSIDSSTLRLDSIKFQWDTIGVTAITSVNKISTTNFFIKSKSILKIDYYYKNGKLIFIKITEPCPEFDDLSKYTEFYYFEDNRIFKERQYCSVRFEMLEPKNKSIYELYGYNKNFSEKFLQVYSVNLLAILKTKMTSLKN
jgi:hypothetical protein